MNKYKHKKTSLLVLGTIIFAASYLLTSFLPAKVYAISYDPYADSVANVNPATQNAKQALGKPNGKHAKLAGTNAILVLDMGKGEEGTSTLKLYLGQRNVKTIRVTFLDSQKRVIKAEGRKLSISPGTSVQNFAYSWETYKKAYRFISITTPDGGSASVDAVEALGYLGSSSIQDTDGDGQTDREEQQNGTNPLVFNPPSNGSDDLSPNTINTGNQNTATQAGGAENQVSDQINPPPPPVIDKDSDKIADTWEEKYDLNPDDKKDAGQDLDHDGLTNLKEFELNSNPTSDDSDSDQMPDEWEFDNGLNINKNDAEKDPDGDFLTNLGEYRHGTDPNKADSLNNIFCGPVDYWWLFILGMICGGGLVYISSRKQKTSKRRRTLARKKKR